MHDFFLDWISLDILLQMLMNCFLIIIIIASKQISPQKSQRTVLTIAKPLFLKAITCSRIILAKQALVNFTVFCYRFIT